MNSLRLPFALALLVVLVSGHAASFDCKKARTGAERMVCSDDELSRLDDELAKIYVRQLRGKPQSDELEGQQLRWIKDRDTCETRDCLRSAYRNRIQTVTQKKKVVLRHYGSWVSRWGDAPLCQVLLDRLNQYDRANDTHSACSLQVLMSQPGLTAPDWEELDPTQHQHLIETLLEYELVGGPETYFGGLPEAKPAYPRSYFKERTEALLKERVRLRLLRTKLLARFGNDTGGEPRTTEPQSIVQMYMPMTRTDKETFCVGKPQPQKDIASWTRTFIVAPDLSGPSQKVDPGSYGVISGMQVMIFKGQLILIGSDSVWGRSTQGELTGICSFRFDEAGK